MILISTHSFLKVTRFYQAGDHLICMRVVIICATLWSDGYKKSRVPSWISLFPGMSERYTHMVSTPSPFSWFPPYCPLISWSQRGQGGGDCLCQVLLRGGTTWASSSLVLSFAVWESRNTAFPGRLLISESLPNGAGVNHSNGSLVSVSDSLSSLTGGCNRVAGHRSLMWWGTPSIRIDCELITSVTCPVPYHVVHLLHGFLTQTTSPHLNPLSRYFPFGQRVGFYALHLDIVSVQCVGWCGGGWNVILWGDIVPVDHLRHRIILPSCDGLDSPVVPLDDPIFARHVGALKPKTYTPAICKLPEPLNGKHGAIVGQYLRWGAMLKEDTL